MDTRQLDSLIKEMESPERTERVLRATALSALAATNARIFGDGKRSNGQALGRYSAAYLVRRQKRPYNRTSRSSITLQLTGTMQNDYTAGLGNTAVLKNTRGYALGFLRDENIKKSGYIEDRYGEVFALSEAEVNSLDAVIEFEMTRLIQ